MFLPAFVCLSVCLSVSMQDYSKRRARIWTKCCVSTDVGTWTNCLTFEPDPDYNPVPEPDCFLRYRMRCNAEFYYVGNIPPIAIGIGRPSLQRRVVLQWFLFIASRRNNVVGGRYAPPCALLVLGATQVNKGF